MSEKFETSAKSFKGVIVLSGGLDSITTLYWTQHYSTIDIVAAVGFNYGQKHKKELEFAKHHCKMLDIPFILIDLWSAGFTEALSGSGSSLVTDTEVPEGHYAANNMASTIVPNRNMVMLSIAGSIAVSMQAQYVITGVHGGDHFIYPDCRPEFIAAMSVTLTAATGSSLVVFAPFISSTKNDIAKEAYVMGIDFSKTWSCYKGGDKHCGRCGTCVERLEAINSVQDIVDTINSVQDVVDNTEYEDSDYWRTVDSANE